MAISTTDGGSGFYAHGATTGTVILFTTPNISNAIFIVTLMKIDETGPGDNYTPTKMIVGPQTSVRVFDSTAAGWSDQQTYYHWVQMVIS